ncbi:MAG: hypothetical protein IPK04_02995 [Bdellovibrionales bacterium]|jgi:hypothetical protein|nr:hypothetical protein [Bdellovibrionales bacterium]
MKFYVGTIILCSMFAVGAHAECLDKTISITKALGMFDNSRNRSDLDGKLCFQSLTKSEIEVSIMQPYILIGDKQVGIDGLDKTLIGEYCKLLGYPTLKETTQDPRRSAEDDLGGLGFVASLFRLRDVVDIRGSRIILDATDGSLIQSAICTLN